MFLKSCSRHTMEMSSDPILEAYTSRKIIIELDYGHFLTPAGWLNLIQIVSIDKRLGIRVLSINFYTFYVFIINIFQVFCFLSLCCCGSPTTISQGYFVVVTSIALVGALIICLGHLKFGKFNCRAKITVRKYAFP